MKLVSLKKFFIIGLSCFCITTDLCSAELWQKFRRARNPKRDAATQLYVVPHSDTRSIIDEPDNQGESDNTKEKGSDIDPSDSENTIKALLEENAVLKELLRKNDPDAWVMVD